MLEKQWDLRISSSNGWHNLAVATFRPWPERTFVMPRKVSRLLISNDLGSRTKGHHSRSRLTFNSPSPDIFVNAIHATYVEVVRVRRVMIGDGIRSWRLGLAGLELAPSLCLVGVWRVLLSPFWGWSAMVQRDRMLLRRITYSGTLLILLISERAISNKHSRGKTVLQNVIDTNFSALLGLLLHKSSSTWEKKLLTPRTKEKAKVSHFWWNLGFRHTGRALPSCKKIDCKAGDGF